MKIERKIIWPIAIILVIFTASSQSSIAIPKTAFSHDKVIHFLVFGLLATSVIRIPQLLEKRWKGVFLTILIVSFYGMTDEFRQMFTAGRSVEFNDWVADTSSAIVASILYFKWNWYRSVLEKRLLGKCE